MNVKTIACFNILFKSYNAFTTKTIEIGNFETIREHNCVAT